MKLQSYVADKWIVPEGNLAPIASAVTGETVAETGTTVRDFKAMLDHARTVGGPALRKMTFHQRAKMLKALGDAVMAKKDELYELSYDTGATIDGGTVAAETRRRDAFRAELTELLDADGVLVLPTVPGAAPLKDARFDDLQAWRERALKLLCWSGLSGFPQITLPLGQIDGAPFGLSLLGPVDSDLDLIRIGHEILTASPQ